MVKNDYVTKNNWLVTGLMYTEKEGNIAISWLKIEDEFRKSKKYIGGCENEGSNEKNTSL